MMPTSTMPGMVAFGMPGVPELLIIAFVGLLIFGKRLPQVARSIGKSIVEFKKGVREVKDDVDSATTTRNNTHMLDSKPQPSLSPPAPGSEPASAAEPNQKIVESGDS